MYSEPARYGKPKTMTEAWAPAAGRPGVAAMQIPLPIEQSPIVAAGFGVLCVFLFLALGRLTDFYLSSLHLPLVISLLAAGMAVLSGRLAIGLGNRNALLLAALTFLIILGIPFGLWRGGSTEIFFDEWLRSACAFLLVTTLVSTVDMAIRVMKIIAYSTLCVAALSMVHAGTLANRLVLTQGLYSGPNELANAAVMGIVSWWFMVAQPHLSFPIRMLYVGGGVFAASLLPRTGSRGGFVTILLLLIVGLFQLKLAMRIVVAVGALLLGSLMFLSLPKEIQLRYTSLFTNVETASTDEAIQMQYAQSSSEERWNLLVDSLTVTMNRPLLGVGIGNFGVARTDGELTGGRTRQSYQGTHNTYTQISSEVGVPGFIIFACLLFGCWRDIRKVEHLYSEDSDPDSKKIRNAAFNLRMLLLSYLIFFCFEHIGYSPFYLIVLGLITAFTHVSLQHHEQRKAAAATKLAAPMQAKTPALLAPASVLPEPPPPPRYRFGGRLARPQTP